MNKSDTITYLQNQIHELQTDLNHLNNKLRLITEKYEQSTKQCFDLSRTIENKVQERVVKVQKTNARLEAEIKERLVAEETLRQKEIYMQTIMDAIPVGVMIIDADTHLIVDINPAAMELTGLTREEMVGKVCRGSICPRDEGECLILDLAQKTVDQSECILLASDDREFPVLKTVTSLELSGHRYIVEIFQDITDQKKLETELERLSITDEMTGLLNRRGFTAMANKLLQIVERGGDELFLLYADFDNLKWINDNLGHTVGDQAIIKTADLLTHTFRQADVIGRIGGDEFVVLFMDKVGSDVEKSATKRFQENLKEVNSRPGQKYEISLSYGLAHYDTTSFTTIENMLSQADKLMYEVKKEKKRARLVSYAK